LRLFNLFQFLPYRFFATRRGLERGLYDTIDFQPAREGVDPAWAFVYEEAMEEAKPLVQKLSKTKVPLPEVGYEIVDEKGCVVAEAELAWPALKIGVVWDKAEQKAEGWEFFGMEEDESLIEALKEKSR